MVHKRYIKRGGKTYGPYFYKSIRTKDGKVRNVYLGSDYCEKKGEREVVQKNNLNLRIAVLLFVFVVLGVVLYTGFNVITGYSSYEPIEGKLLLENIGEQTIHAGQKYDVNFETEMIGGSLLFKDDTSLFDIRNDGKLKFKPKKSDAGNYSVAVIARSTEDYDEVYFRILRFVVLE